MSSNTETSEAGPLDTVKLLLAAAILVGGMVAFYVFPEQSVLVRTLGVVGATVVAMLVFLQTAKGRGIAGFIQGSRMELRKMHWPSRQETVQTTIAVLIMVFLVGVFLWLLDMGLLWLSKYLTGQGG